MNPRSSKRLLCEPCKDGSHTSPPHGSTLCQCDTRTCACSVVPPRAA